jgi:hypothetical protein
VTLCSSSRITGLVLVVCLQPLITPSVCRADLLPVIFQPGAPIVGGSNGALTYNASTGDFNLTVSAPTLTYAGPFVNPPPGNNFALIASPKLIIDLKVNTSGNFVANGTGVLLTGTVSFKDQFGGTVTFSGTTSANPLLSGTVTNFGAQAVGPPSLSFDGYYNVTGGALTQTRTDSMGNPIFGGFPLGGGTGGFLIDAENVTGGTLGDFTHNFSSSNVKPEVGTVTPAPPSLTLALAGVLCPPSRNDCRFLALIL